MTTPRVRPRRDWALVLVDERQERLASGIFLPGQETGVEKVTETSGRIIRLGPSEHRVEMTGLCEGQRIIFRAFMKHHMPVPSEETWHSGAKKEFFLMDTADILAVIAEDVSVGVFSRPSQSAVESVDEDGNVKMKSNRELVDSYRRR